jgi:hypothetical protein
MRVLAAGGNDALVGALSKHVEYVPRDKEEEEEKEMEYTAAEAGDEAEENVALRKHLDTDSLFFVIYRTFQILKIEMPEMFSVFESVEKQLRR